MARPKQPSCMNSCRRSRRCSKTRICFGVGSDVNIDYFDMEGGIYQAYAIYAPANAARLEAAFKEEIAWMLKEGFTEQEVAEANKVYMQSRIVPLAQDNSLAATLNTYQYYGEPIAMWQKIEDGLVKLQSQQVNSAMQKYLDLNKINIVKAGDFANKKATAIK
jgi:zinc protease